MSARALRSTLFLCLSSLVATACGAGTPTVEQPPPASSTTPGTFTPPPAPISQKSYTGRHIDLDVKDAEIVDLMHLFADVGDVKIMVDPGVKGLVTLKVKDQPWDALFERILKEHGLKAVSDGRGGLVVSKAL